MVLNTHQGFIMDPLMNIHDLSMKRIHHFMNAFMRREQEKKKKLAGSERMTCCVSSYDPNHSTKHYFLVVSALTVPQEPYFKAPSSRTFFQP